MCLQCHSRKSFCWGWRTWILMTTLSSWCVNRNWEVRRLLPASMQTSNSSGSAFQNMSYSSGWTFAHHHTSIQFCLFFSFHSCLSRFWHGIFNVVLGPTYSSIHDCDFFYTLYKVEYIISVALLRVNSCEGMVKSQILVVNWFFHVRQLVENSLKVSNRL